MTKLSGIKACVFDALGTLIDELGPLEVAFKELVEAGVDAGKLRQVIDIWPHKTLEYLWLGSLMGIVCHGDISREALDYALRVAQLDDPRARPRLLASLDERRFYTDVVGAIRTLRQRGFQTAILSGSPPEPLRRLIDRAGLTGDFDAVLSAIGAHAVKPEPEVYQIAIDELSLTKQDVCFVSGNPWDAAGAAYFGFQVIPIIRRKDGRYLQENLPEHPNRPGRLGPPIRSMADLPNRLR